jgi:signal transduction histidine kinase
VIRPNLEPSFEPEKDFGRLLDRALHPPLRDLRFWGVQVLVFAIAALLWGIKQSGNIEPAGIPAYVPVCLFVIPVAYAALNFGLAGSLATAGWTVLLSLPLVLLQAPSRLYLWAEITQFSMVIFVAVFVGDRVEREVLARQQAERIQAALRQLFEASPVPTILLSKAGRILQANASALHMFGARGDSRLPADLTELVGRETALDILARKGTPFELSVPAGGERVLRPVAAAWELSEGPGLQVMFFDVSEEQRRADRADAYAAWVLRGHEEERQRIAKELHDEPVQSLVHLCRQLDLLAEQSPAGDHRQGVIEVRSLATSITEDLRRIAKGLRPPSLDDLGLVASVRRLTRDLEQRHGLKVDLRISGRRARLPTDTELGLFRIAQEALRNVERHAGAGQVEVGLEFTTRAVRLRIRDDGRGFDSQADWARTGSLGLIGMQERATLLGGELQVESTTGTGTTVRAWLPAPRAEAAPEGLPVRGQH